LARRNETTGGGDGGHGGRARSAGGDQRRSRALRLISFLVPWEGRGEWLREWRGELAYDQRLRRGRGDSALRRTLAGLLDHGSATEDALRLRLHRRPGSAPLQEVRFAIRALAARPLWTVAAAGTLALGIGTTTTIFSLVYGMLLRPLPYEDPERLLAVSRTLTYGLYEGLREQQQSFDDVGVWDDGRRALRLGEQPELIDGAMVNAALFPTLGIQPALGRNIADAEDQEGAQGSVLLSHGLWSDRFGADPSVIGEVLFIDDHPHTIVGVMPEGVSFPARGTMFWASMAHANRTPQTWYLRAVGRVRTDSSLDQARAGLDLVELWDPSTEDGPPERHQIDVVPLHEHTVGRLRQLLLLFQGAVAAVLLIATLNVANLVLARSADREREITVRAALGAGKARLVRLALTETVVLGLVGGSAGIALSYLLLQGVLVTVPEAVPLQEQVGIHLPVVAAALGLSLGVGLLVGLVPALRAGGISLRAGLQDGARGFTGGIGRQRLRKSLVAVQLGLALVLLVGGGLLLRSFMGLWNVDPGFEPGRVLGVSIAVPESTYPGQDPKRVFYDELLDRLNGLPGVQRAAGAGSFPFTGAFSQSRFQIEGYDHGEEEGVRSESQIVTPGYFETLGIPLLTGRVFDETDSADVPIVIINESFARAYFPEGAIGHRIHGLWQSDDWFTIVGVVGDIHHRGLDVPLSNQVYFPFSTASWHHGLSVSVRTEGDPLSLAGPVREVVASLDSDIPVPNTFPLTRLMENSVREQRFITGLLGVFAVTAVLMAIVGVYGVVAYGVSTRTRELGIRIALGAEARRVTRDVVVDGALMTGVGLLFGLAGALAVSGALQSLLFDLDARDPAVFGVAAVSLVVAAITASYLPARRAGRVDPVQALRAE